MIITRPFDKKAISDLYNERPEELLPIDLDYILSEELNAKNQIYCFYTDDKRTLLGVIFFTEQNKKLFINGFSVRKNLKNIITALNTVINAYKCDLYADTESKAAIRVLKMIGFKQIENNLLERKTDVRTN